MLAAVAPPAWHTAASMPERRSYFAAAQLGGDVYVAGGMVGASGTYVRRLERFDPRRRRREEQRLRRAIDDEQVVALTSDGTRPTSSGTSRGTWNHATSPWSRASR